MTDERYVVLDVERAAGRGAPHVVELAAISIEEGEVADTFERLVCPLVPIEAEASAIHGITDEDVREAPPTEAVLEEFAAWCGDSPLVAHDARSDAGALGHEYARHRLEPPGGPVLDTLALARKEIPEALGHDLEGLAEHLELEADGHHRALPDAVWCWQVLEECVRRRGERTGLEVRVPVLALESATSIALARPREPRLPRRLRPLARAVESGTTLWIAYGDGPAPPARVSLRPRLLYHRGGKDYVEGECGSSGTWKTWLLSRIRKVF